ncbi:MAG: 6-pyruvoyl-tetrahydropterin synthase-related protein, partial [bacterium]
MLFFRKHRLLNNNFSPVLIFLFLALFIFKPILSNVWYSMHDTTHVARLYLMEQTIRAGQFPPIWAEGINNGFGYPLFHFYAPLFYYLALSLKLIVGSYFTALKITLFSSIFIGMLGMYQLIKKWGRAPAILAGVAFGTLPYLAVDLYVRGAYSELLAMSLLPWLFYAWQNLSSRPRQITAGVITTLFLLSHNLIPLITFPF